MAAGERERITQAARIVARIPRAEAASEMAAALESHVTAFEHVSPESHADIVDGLRRSLMRWSRFLSTGKMPADSDFDQLREWARARAGEGVRLEDLLRSFGLLHQLGWSLLRRHARDEESEALLELAGLLAQYVAEISSVVTETYLAERELLVSEEERRTQTLLDRLCSDTPLGAGDSELAERLGVPVQRAYRPFVVVLPGQPPQRYGALAARLRRAGWHLAVTQSESVVGLTWRPLELSDLGEGPQALLAIGTPTDRGELHAAREELVVLAEHARRVGLFGVLDADDYLLEMIVGRSPALVRRLRAKVLAPMLDSDRLEPARTLRALISCRFDRTATSALLHVHRNTLAYRLRRIEQITGLDLGSPRDLACVYVAMEAGVEERGDRSDGPSPP